MTVMREFLGLWDFQIFTVLLARKSLISRWRGTVDVLPAERFTVHTVIPAFTEELDTVAFEVTDQVSPFHEIEARGSRITVLFRRDSSVNARLDSNTS